VSTAVLRKAGSDRILKLLAQYLKKIILAHHTNSMELMKTEDLGFSMVSYENSHRGEMKLGALVSSTCTPDTYPDLLFSPA